MKSRLITYTKIGPSYKVVINNNTNTHSALWQSRYPYSSNFHSRAQTLSYVTVFTLTADNILYHKDNFSFLRRDFSLSAQIFFTLCAEKVYYKVCNTYYKVSNTCYKVCNTCYKLCNKKYPGLNENAHI